MKIKIAELKKALDWVEKNSKDVIIDINIDENRQSFIQIKCQDNYQTYVEIKVFNDGTMLPKIIKETNLP